LHGLAYTLGILVSFALLGGVLIALKAVELKSAGLSISIAAVCAGCCLFDVAVGLSLSVYFQSARDGNRFLTG